MRHYIWYRTDGSIGGHMQRQGGFPGGCDPSDPATTDPIAVGLRARHTAEPDYAGIVAYDCACPCEGFCACCSNRPGDSRVDGGVVTAMPSMQWSVDGVLTAPHAVDAPGIDKTPGADVNVKLVGAVADGVQVQVRGGGPPDLAAALPIVLTFTGGETNLTTLRAPPAGLTGRVVAFHRLYVPVSRLKLRGW